MEKAVKVCLRVFLRFGWAFALSGRDRFSALGNALEVIPDRLVFGKTEFFVQSVPHAFDAPGRYAHKTGDFLRAVVLFYQYAGDAGIFCLRQAEEHVYRSVHAYIVVRCYLTPCMISGIIRLNLAIWPLLHGWVEVSL